MFNFRRTKENYEGVKALSIENSVEDRTLKSLEIDELNSSLLKTNERLLSYFTEVMKNM